MRMDRMIDTESAAEGREREVIPWKLLGVRTSEPEAAVKGCRLDSLCERVRVIPEESASLQGY